MAHEKVYGICEDKCREEVIPKSQYYLFRREGERNPGSGTIILRYLPYPEGFTYKNCIVVGGTLHLGKNVGSYEKTYRAWDRCDYKPNSRLEIDLTEQGIAVYGYAEDSDADAYAGYCVLFALMRII